MINLIQYTCNKNEKITYKHKKKQAKTLDNFS